MGALSQRLVHEMVDLKADIVALLGRVYGEICIFEHGPAVANRKVGCGVDHAHLHVVPLKFDLVSAVMPFVPLDVRWRKATWATCRAAFESGQDYIYIEQPIGSGRIATHHDFGSQVVRKTIAARLGVPEQFSWRDYPQIETVTRTIQTLSGSVDLAV
jgi:hypothetical protein